MATFGKATFNTAIYASFRPTYPRQLFDFVFSRHNGRWDTAVDLGCGTGQATTELTPFRHVVGVDPSAKMLDVARGALRKQGLDASRQFEYVQAAAEDLSFLRDGSVDMMIAAQACHWFDWTRMWPEAARVLRKDGTAAFWIYSEFRLSRYPSLSPLIITYSQGTDPATSLGPHWEQPGRGVLDGHLMKVPDPTVELPGRFHDFERVFFTGNHFPELQQARPVILRKRLTWDDLLQYLHTWSSLHTYRERYPADVARTDGDIAARFIRDLQKGIAEKEGKMPQGRDEVDIEFPLVMLLVKKT